MGWPPMWGYYFWFYIHASAFSLKDQGALTEEDSRQIKIFFDCLCYLLPCPACRYHCIAYTGKDLPDFKSGEQYWQYTVRFHNDVNLRNEKVCFTVEEAVESLRSNASDYGLQLDADHTFENTFISIYWDLVMYATFTYSSDLDNATSQERKRLLNFVKSFCHTLPYRNYQAHASDNASVTAAVTLLSHLLQYYETLVEEDVSSRKKAQKVITDLYNIAATSFNLVPKTTSELLSVFMQNFKPEIINEISRAQQIRKEDHSRSLQLSAKLQQCESHSHLKVYKNGVIFLSISLGTCVVLLIIMTGILVKLHRKNSSTRQKTSI